MVKARFERGSMARRGAGGGGGRGPTVRRGQKSGEDESGSRGIRVEAGSSFGLLRATKRNDGQLDLALLSPLQQPLNLVAHRPGSSWWKSWTPVRELVMVSSLACAHRFAAGSQ